MKDEDFIVKYPNGLILDANVYTSLMESVESDCRVLESVNVYDYSLLLAIHNLDLAAKEEHSSQPGLPPGKFRKNYMH